MERSKGRKTVAKRAANTGCFDCRLHKVLCDNTRVGIFYEKVSTNAQPIADSLGRLRQPRCFRCTNAGRKCNYAFTNYAFTWVVVEPAQNAKSSKLAHKEPELQLVPLDHGKLPTSLVDWRDLQTQMCDIFVEDCRPGHSRMDCCFTSVLIETDLSPKPVSLITDALALLHASSKDPHRDPRLLHEAGKVYGTAMHHLRRQLISISHPQSQTDSHSILLCMMLLGLYDASPHISPQLNLDARSWDYHLEAAVKFVNGVGPEAFDMSKPSDAAAVLSTTIVSFKACLSFRRTMLFDQQILHSLCAKIAKTLTIPEVWFEWLYILQPLPGLLAQADALLDSDCDTSTLRLTGIMQELAQIRPKIQTSMKTIINPLITIEDPKNLDVGIEEHVVLLSNTLFKPQYGFPNLTVAKIYVLVWISSLIADCTALRIIHHRLPNCTRTAKELERSAFVTASKLCQSVQFLSERDSLTYVHIVKSVVALAGAFFAEACHVEGTAWCGACQTASEIRLRRLELVRPRTLCRAFNVAPALVAAVQFRSPTIPQPEHLII